MEDARTAAERDGVNLNAFIVQALAEKVAMLRARGGLRELTTEEQTALFDARRANGDPQEALEILARAGTPGPLRPGDELPDDWPAPRHP